jgi:hypothetical protein
VTPVELAALGAGLCLFALPFVMIGGSVQALTRGLLLTLSCWLLAAICVHRFAAPWRTAPHPVEARGEWSVSFVREGLVFLLMALGPVAFLISGTMVLWNR